MAKLVKKETPSGRIPGSLYSLVAESRTVFGRKVKRLRKSGVLPANITGKHIDSVSIQVRLDDFMKVFSDAGETGLVSLELGGKLHPVLVHEIHWDPVYGTPLHADFLEVNLSEKVTATVPIELTGESPAEKAEEGVVVQQMHEVEVEALPTDLPEKIVVDISGLVSVDDAIKVSELSVDRTKVEIKEEDSERIVVSVAAPAKQEEPVVEAPAGGEVAEGEKEGEASTESGEQAGEVSEENKEP